MGHSPPTATSTFLVVSEEFRKQGFMEDMEVLGRLWNGLFTLEMFPYTLEQLEIVVTEALEGR